MIVFETSHAPDPRVGMAGHRVQKRYEPRSRLSRSRQHEKWTSSPALNSHADACRQVWARAPKPGVSSVSVSLHAVCADSHPAAALLDALLAGVCRAGAGNIPSSVCFHRVCKLEPWP